MLSLTFIVIFFSIEYWTWYPLKACLFEEGPIFDVLLLYFLTYYYVELLRRAFWPGKNHKYFKKHKLHMEY